MEAPGSAGTHVRVLARAEVSAGHAGGVDLLVDCCCKEKICSKMVTTIRLLKIDFR